MFAFLTFLLFVVCVCGYLHMCVSRSEDSFQESGLAFHHVGAKDQTQAIKLDGKHLYPYCFS